MTAIAALLPDGRLHLQHGPIDCLCRVWGHQAEMRAAYRQAAACFATVLPDLCAELPLLRTPLPSSLPQGAIARRMHAACLPFSAGFITPMDLQDPFNDYLYEKLLLVIEELNDCGGGRRLPEQLKPLLARPPDTLRINRKGTPQFDIPNVVRPLFGYQKAAAFYAQRAGFRRHPYGHRHRGQQHFRHRALRQRLRQHATETDTTAAAIVRQHPLRGCAIVEQNGAGGRAGVRPKALKRCDVIFDI
jgi:hypothetical protein